MIINYDDLNAIANITNLGFVTTLLKYNKESYELNKRNYEINKKILEENSDKDIINILSDLYFVMNEIKGDLDIIIERMGCDKNETNRQTNL